MLGFKDRGNYLQYVEGKYAFGRRCESDVIKSMGKEDDERNVRVTIYNLYGSLFQFILKFIKISIKLVDECLFLPKKCHFSNKRHPTIFAFQAF